MGSETDTYPDGKKETKDLMRSLGDFHKMARLDFMKQFALKPTEQ